MQIGFGCVNLGSASRGRSFEADVRLVRDAIDQGVRVFDTADVYGAGMSEQILGRAVQRRRDEVTIATKGGYCFRPRKPIEQTARRYAAVAKRAIERLRRPSTGGDGGGGTRSGLYDAQDFSADYLRAAVEASLRRLATDHIDVYQLHGPKVVSPEVLRQLEDLVIAGKVGRFGVGAESVADAAAWTPVDGVGVVQVPFGVLDPEAADDVFPLAKQHDVEIWARGVLGGGVLAAAIDRPAAIAGHPKRLLVARLQEVATRHGIGLDELAIGFARSVPQISTVLLGISTPEHLRRNLDLVAADPLDSSIVADVRSVLPTTGTAEG